MTTEKSISVWCPRCGIQTHHNVEVDAPVKPYTITDAQADAAVLRELHLLYGCTPGDCGVKIRDTHDTIINRLHAFYCGTGAE